MESVSNTHFLYGLDDRNIDYAVQPAGVHKSMLFALQALQQQAREKGFAVAVVSGYRDFERQLAIWNAKAEGRRPLLDSQGHPLDPRDLTDWECVKAILRWSALPGASRHHWGTDIDIFDKAAVPAEYSAQLTDDEVWGSGPFTAMHDWLDEWLATEGRDFFRPYALDRGGVAPERWHLSYAPLSSQYQQQWDKNVLARILDQRELALKETVLSHWDEICSRYVEV